MRLHEIFRNVCRVQCHADEQHAGNQLDERKQFPAFLCWHVHEFNLEDSPPKMPTGQMNRPRSPSWWDTSAMPFLSGIQGVMQDRLRQVSTDPFLPYAEAAASAGLLGTGDKGARQGLLDGTALATTAVPGYGDAL
jgi:hypothetical protein